MLLLGESRGVCRRVQVSEEVSTFEAAGQSFVWWTLATCYLRSFGAADMQVMRLLYSTRAYEEGIERYRGYFFNYTIGNVIRGGRQREGSGG